jgi:pilus assembly protein Flp/PilA
MSCAQAVGKFTRRVPLTQVNNALCPLTDSVQARWNTACRASGGVPRRHRFDAVPAMRPNLHGVLNMSGHEKPLVTHLPRKQQGLTTVEYAVAGGLLAAVVIGAFQALGLQVGVIIDGIVTLLGG